MTAAAPSQPKVSVSEVIRKVSTIATLPEVMSRIIETVEDPNGTAADLHKIISHDPALVTRILKMVNSAFYGLPGQIASIERAIVLLGLNAVKNIAVAASLGQLFRGGRLCEGFTARDLWTHCVGVGVAARELARQMRVPLADEAFLAGMIHDLGLLASLQAFPDRLRSICETVRTTGRPLCEVEIEALGVTHQQLGAALAEHWKFPRSCQLVAGHHHNPTALPRDNRLLVSLVFAADTLCCEVGPGFDLTATGQKLSAGALEEVALDPAMIERVKEQLPALVSAAAAILG